MTDLQIYNDHILNACLTEEAENRPAKIWEIIMWGHIVGIFKFRQGPGQFQRRKQLIKYIQAYYDCPINEAEEWVVIYEEVFRFFFEPKNQLMLKSQRIHKLADYMARIASNQSHFFDDMRFKDYL